MRPAPDDLGSYLDHDEKILWSGQPPEGVIFHGYDFFYIPFSLIWGAFALFWNGAVWLGVLSLGLKNGFVNIPAGLWMFTFFGLPFLVMGYYIVVGRFQSDAAERARTLYAITTHRALIARGPRVRDVRSYELSAGAQVQVSERRDGSGTIVFGQPDPWFLIGTPGTWVRSPEFKFERIPRVRDVARLVNEGQRNA